MTFEIVGPEVEARLDWIALTEALAAGHALPRAEVADTLLRRGGDTLLTRSAWIEGMGVAVKAATIYPGNPKLGIAAVNGAVNLFSSGTRTCRPLRSRTAEHCRFARQMPPCRRWIPGR